MKKISWRSDMVRTTSRNGRSISSRDYKISLAASGDPIYPSEALIQAITELFSTVSPDCVQRANEAIAENPNISREELIGILTQPECFGEEYTSDEETNRRSLFAWAIANPGKAALLGLGIVAGTVVASWLTGSLLKKMKIKKTIGSGMDKIRRMKEISSGIERGEAYKPDAMLALTQDEIKNISAWDPAVLAIDELDNVRLNLFNPISKEFDLMSLDVQVKYYKKGEKLNKPYLQNVVNVNILPTDLSSRKTSLSPGEKRSDTLSLGRVPRNYTTSPEHGTLLSMRPVIAYLKEKVGGGVIKIPVSLAAGTNIYFINTLSS